MYLSAVRLYMKKMASHARAGVVGDAAVVPVDPAHPEQGGHEVVSVLPSDTVISTTKVSPVKKWIRTFLGYYSRQKRIRIHDAATMSLNNNNNEKNIWYLLNQKKKKISNPCRVQILVRIFTPLIKFKEI